MYDWWFSWHLVDPSRYKLWFPLAHRYAWRLPETLVTNASAPTSSRYIGTHSFIDEYIGNSAAKLTVNFIDPAVELGFNTSSYASAGIETIVAGRLNSGSHTANVTGHSYLMHQIRRKPDGSGEYELRSRFFIEQNPGTQIAHDMLAHCNTEMQHLASFLPALWAEFKDTI